MPNAITTQRLTKYYGKRRVVDSLDLKVPAGSVYGFLGRNGAGKSTAIKMLMGMVRPDSGTATLLGEPFDEIKPETRARIAYIAEGHPLYGWMTIAEVAQVLSISEMTVCRDWEVARTWLRRELSQEQDDAD